MSKLKSIYICQACGAQHRQWGGQCTQCGAWNSIQEEPAAIKIERRREGYAGTDAPHITRMCEVTLQQEARISTGLAELDLVLGQGLVAGSVILIGGDPGIGKSTLLLQTLCHLSQQHSTLYITGEESLQQVTLRAQRLNLPTEELRLLTSTHIETILTMAAQEKPQVMVIDSIQTMFTDTVSSAPGSVSQVRESAAQLVQFSKQTGTALFLVGHVTKEGALAGPRVLEHMVDTVLYFEGQKDSRYRMIRAVKNRFGAVNELGLFAMTDKGLRPVSNPSAIFLSRNQQPTPGSTITVTWEGSRPLLVEVQALVDQSHLANPRRVTLGLEQNRLALLLAVLHRHAGVVTYDQDVFVNVVGGVRILETGADLAVLLAVLSSLRNHALPQDLICFGEIGLAGEIRPVQSGQERIQEASKHGFKQAIVPHANAPKQAPKNIKILPATHISDALTHILG